MVWLRKIWPGLVLILLVGAFLMLRTCCTRQTVLVPPRRLHVHMTQPERVVYVPAHTDSALIHRLLRERDSLRRMIAATGAEITLRYDTVIVRDNTADTVRVDCNEIAQTATVYIHEGPRAVTIMPDLFSMSIEATATYDNIDAWHPRVAAYVVLPVHMRTSIVANVECSLKARALVPRASVGVRYEF